MTAADLNPKTTYEFPSSDPDVLRSEFRSLISFLVLVASINNEGHPTLDAFKDIQSHGESSKEIRNSAMTVLASILVRNHEVIAVMGTSSAHPFEILTLQDENELEETPVLSTYVQQTIKSFTALGNPRQDSTNGADMSPSQISYWNKIMKNEWWGLHLDE